MNALPCSPASAPASTPASTISRPSARRLPWWRALAGVVGVSLLATVTTWFLPGVRPALRSAPSVDVAGDARPVDAKPVEARAALPAGLSLIGVIPASKDGPGIALLKEARQPVVLVAEGDAYNADVRVAQILADQVVLHRRGESRSYVLQIGATPAFAANYGN
jgi:hypothetical protein